MLSSFYRLLVCRRFINVVLFIVLLQHFICVGAIQTDKADLFSQRYRIMIIGMLKNWSCKYYSHYFIKFIGFIPIYYVINMVLFHPIWFLAICILNLSIYSEFESIILFFLKKKNQPFFEDLIFLRNNHSPLHFHTFWHLSHTL